MQVEALMNDIYKQNNMCNTFVMSMVYTCIWQSCMLYMYIRLKFFSFQVAYNQLCMLVHPVKV